MAIPPCCPSSMTCQPPHRDTMQGMPLTCCCARASTMSPAAAWRLLGGQLSASRCRRTRAACASTAATSALSAVRKRSTGRLRASLLRRSRGRWASSGKAGVQAQWLRCWPRASTTCRQPPARPQPCSPPPASVPIFCRGLRAGVGAGSREEDPAGLSAGREDD